MPSNPLDIALPPFAYAAESVEFEQRWMEEIPRRLYEMQTEVIPESNMLKYYHGEKWTFSTSPSEEMPSEFKEHREMLVVDPTLRQGGELDKLAVLADELARKFAQSGARLMEEVVDTVTQKTGNVVTWSKAQKNAPKVFLELLRKVQFGVTKEGKPSLPTLVNFDPAFLAELREYMGANPEYERELEQVKAEKVKEALAMEAERKAKFRRAK